ncbi:hypothetical protein SAMD00023353_3000370 [Rosellinia necatrix]|uniref:Uncharacterized protein n=1 Tax=Rosellinia necatrix TaxID=77044 RepID=A0A1S8A8L2_ROSNE|nr:hypothetical protein SAMD00023353_3000370 [Rosellinia necatrix]
MGHFHRWRLADTETLESSSGRDECTPWPYGAWVEMFVDQEKKQQKQDIDVPA